MENKPLRKIIQEGSVRVDLVGGTLDLEPIAYILHDTVTINVATSLKAIVQISATSENGVRIISKDYAKEVFFSETDFTEKYFYQEGLITHHHFKEFLFIVLLLRHFNCCKNVQLELSSGSPAGSGLGGSSAMGITCYKALCQWMQQPFSEASALQVVRSIEATILNHGVAGYQDYYPALYGGVLALKPHFSGIVVQQLYTEALKDFLEKNIALIYSGQSRHSGLNNWQVFKGFFDKDSNILNAMKRVAAVSHQAFQALEQQNYPFFLDRVVAEGELRGAHFTGLVTDIMHEFSREASRSFPGTFKGIKVCGAGGGGCFLAIGVNAQKLETIVAKFGMKILPFFIERPLVE